MCTTILDLSCHLVISFWLLFVGDQNEQEPLISSQEPYNYHVGWRKLQRASVKYIQSHVHGDLEHQINLDHSARIHSAAGNGSLVLPVIFHSDTSREAESSDLFQLCCKVHIHIFVKQSPR